MRPPTGKRGKACKGARLRRTRGGYTAGNWMSAPQQHSLQDRQKNCKLL